MDNLLLGLLSAAVAGGLFGLREYGRRSRLKQPWTSPADAQRESHPQQLQQLQEHNQGLQAQLAEQQQQLQQLDQQHDAARQELQLFLENFDNSSQEQKIQTQQATIQTLESEQAILRDRLKTLEAALQAAHERLAEGIVVNSAQFKALICLLLPNLEFLRDSLEVMLQLDLSRLHDLLATLKALGDGTLNDGHRQAVRVVKVRSTDGKWSECRVPHVSMMRIYFQKNKLRDSYQVLVSPKKDQKTQDKDYEWLKSQGSEPARSPHSL